MARFELSNTGDFKPGLNRELAQGEDEDKDNLTLAIHGGALLRQQGIYGAEAVAAGYMQHPDWYPGRQTETKVSHAIHRAASLHAEDSISPALAQDVAHHCADISAQVLLRRQRN
jgi:hypothetical protein